MNRGELDDERTFLCDSLEDLERERDAGDLSEEDYTVLRDRYTRAPPRCCGPWNATSAAPSTRRSPTRRSPGRTHRARSGRRRRAHR